MEAAHLDGPEEDAGQEQGDEETHPHWQRQQRVTVPGIAEPGHHGVKVCHVSQLITE